MRPTCALLFAATVTGCTIAAAPAGSMNGGTAALPPVGHGTLLQREISVSLTSRDLEIMITPLDESITRVTAPDTYERLSRIANAHRLPGEPNTTLFLVSFFSDQPDVRFIPEEVQLISRGLRVRPTSVIPITPTWGQHRVRQQETETAVYAFSGEVDLESDLVFAYGLDQTPAWSGVRSRIQAERARARARAGIGG